MFLVRLISAYQMSAKFAFQILSARHGLGDTRLAP